MMMQSWMGSDFTNDDLVQEASIVEDYTHTLLGDTTMRDREAWVIEMTPRPEAPVVWDRVKAWITKEHYIQLRAEYYGEDGELVNTLVMEDIQQMGGRLLPKRWVMKPADEKDQQTVMTYESISFDIALQRSFFSLQNMKRVRK
jgi:outer membrane lipoprotein-sorting protein